MHECKLCKVSLLWLESVIFLIYSNCKKITVDEWRGKATNGKIGPVQFSKNENGWVYLKE